MISIQAFMLIALGFLLAAFAGLLTVPAYRRRIERLTLRKIRRSMPLTEAEIRADKDRLRAENALVVYELEHKLEKATLAAARQRVDINRRDAAISDLEGEVERLRTSLEEHENARRVLEQTIVDRLPKVEQRLAEARKLLMQRDREVAELSETTQRQARSLEDASFVNTHSRDEVHRLTAALKVRSSRNRSGGGRGREAEDESGLSLELETLREKTRDQAARIVRLEGMLARPNSSAETLSVSGPVLRERPEEVARLREDLAEAEAALRAAQSLTEAGRRRRDELEAEVRALKAKTEDHVAEIGRLKAGLAAYQGAEKEHSSLAQSKVAMHAQIATLQAQTADQELKIKSLKAEIAAANERTARQAADHMEEMRRLGSGMGREGLRGSGDAEQQRARHSLADRIGRLSVGEARDLPAGAIEDAREHNGRVEASAEDLERAANHLKSLAVETAGRTNGNGQSDAEPSASNAGEGREVDADGAGEPLAAGRNGLGKEAAESQPRGGLLARITRLDRPGRAE